MKTSNYFLYEKDLISLKEYCNIVLDKKSFILNSSSYTYSSNNELIYLLSDFTKNGLLVLVSIKSKSNFKKDINDNYYYEVLIDKGNNDKNKISLGYYSLIYLPEKKVLNNINVDIRKQKLNKINSKIKNYV